MDSTELIAQKLCSINSPDIIYNIGIPKSVKNKLTISKIMHGLPMSFFEDESFLVAVDLGEKQDQYCAILCNITQYDELFCNAVTPFIRNESKENFKNRVERIRENL